MLDILLPFWGDPRYLYQTVDAVLAQDDDRWRLTIVDDCYPDTSVQDHFDSLKDSRVRYIRHEHNVGITENYRRCIELATEEHLVLLGCDDVPHPGYVRRVHKLIDRFPQAAIIQPGVEVIDSTGQVTNPLADRVKRLVRPRAQAPRLLAGEDLVVSLLRADWLYWPALVFRRDVIARTPFRPGFPIIQDLAVVNDIVINGGSLVLDPVVTFSYRRHEASASSAALLDGRRFDGERRYFELAERLVRRNGWTRAARAARIHSTSRAHAMALLPTALRTMDRKALLMLIDHIIA